MYHQCGKSYFNSKIDTVGGFSNYTVDNNFSPESVNNITTDNKKIKLYTAYLGEVEVNIADKKDKDTTHVDLELSHCVGGKNIDVKIINAKKVGFKENNRYNLSQLRSFPSYRLNLEDNLYNYILSLLSRKKLADVGNNSDLSDKYLSLLSPFNTHILYKKIQEDYPVLFEDKHNIDEYRKIYKKSLVNNIAVDIFFGSYNYLDFLYKSSGMISVNKLPALVAICNVDDLDNAYFTGEYSLYGNGRSEFYPLGSLDVVGHELSHGLVAGTANLEYKGHSGALNEHFADVYGKEFEDYMYETFPHLLGESDWFLGEDFGITKKFLRNMSKPEECNQPSKYKGKFYLNPYSQTDHGGVHINSGIPNYCFYLACTKSKNPKQIFKYFTDCLKSLSKHSNFTDFRDTLLSVSNNNNDILNALNSVGLDSNAISDYTIKKPTHRPLPHRPLPHRPLPHRRSPYPYPLPTPRRRSPYPPYPLPRRRNPYPIPYPRGHRPYPTNRLPRRFLDYTCGGDYDDHTEDHSEYYRDYYPEDYYPEDYYPEDYYPEDYYPEDYYPEDYYP